MKLLSLLALTGLVFVFGCKSTEDEIQNNKILFTNEVTSNKDLLFHLSNSDIKWGGGRVGLEPKIKGKPAKLLLERGKEVTPFLIRGLEDEEKFIACHVLLTKLNLDGYYPLDGRKWNELAIKLLGKGEIECDKGQVPDLVKFWDKALKLKEIERLEKAGEE